MGRTKRWSQEQKRLQQLIRAVRMEAGLTQVELSKRLGRPQSYVSKLEVGERGLGWHGADELCQAIGIDLAAFARRFRPATPQRKRKVRR